MTAISANTVIFSYNTNTINITVSKYLKLVIVSNHFTSPQSIKHKLHFYAFENLYVVLAPEHLIITVIPIIVPDSNNILVLSW